MAVTSLEVYSHGDFPHYVFICHQSKRPERTFDSMGLFIFERVGVEDSFIKINGKMNHFTFARYVFVMRISGIVKSQLQVVTKTMVKLYIFEFSFTYLLVKLILGS
jgi:hypothetical protein